MYKTSVKPTYKCLNRPSTKPSASQEEASVGRSDQIFLICPDKNILVNSYIVCLYLGPRGLEKAGKSDVPIIPKFSLCHSKGVIHY